MVKQIYDATTILRWVDQARQGNEEAFERLQEQYEDLFYLMYHRYKFKYLDVEDVYQECLLTLHISIQKYQDDKGASFATFLYNSLEQSMNNLYLYYQRDKRKANTSALSLEFTKNDKEECSTIKDFLIHESSDYPEQIVNQLLLQDAFRYLTEKERIVITNRNNEWTLEEIGELLDITREAVRKIEERGLLKLRALLTNENLAVILPHKSHSESMYHVLHLFNAPRNERTSLYNRYVRKYSQGEFSNNYHRLGMSGRLTRNKKRLNAELTEKGKHLWFLYQRVQRGSKKTEINQKNKMK